VTVSTHKAAGRAAVYTRISRDFTGAGAGVARQEQDCREKAHALGWDVAEVYADNDISAYSGKRRPRYEAILDAIRTGQIDGVIVWHTDRLYRRVTDLEEYISVCGGERRGIPTYTVKAEGSLDLAQPVPRQPGVVRLPAQDGRIEGEPGRRCVLDLRRGDRPDAAAVGVVAPGVLDGGPRSAVGAGWLAAGGASAGSPRLQLVRRPGDAVGGRDPGRRCGVLPASRRWFHPDAAPRPVRPVLHREQPMP